VRWAERNHDFAKWSRRIVENGICRPVAINPITTVDKLLEGGGLGRRQYRIAAVGSSAMLANQEVLQTGDVIGFVSRRSDLDYFHTGFIAFDRSGRLMLRQASQSRGRVIDEDMRSFIARTGVKYVTLLRAEQRAFA
jgi:N-acetylmuramoyl-L-alanine amidase-like